MKCKAPFTRGVEAFPCGRCAPCLVNRASVWSTRLHLESLLHGDSVFVTLTYNDENLPPEVSRSHVSAFIKSLRQLLYPVKFRFFICAEYGSQFGRPHYHGILFGLSQFHAEAIGSAWKKGFVQVGDCNTATIRYVTKYVTKGDSRAVEVRLRKTWALMSRNPGIGRDSLKHLSAKTLDSVGLAPGVMDRDVPTNARLDGKLRPLGRYLVGKLRIHAGITGGSEPLGRKLERVREIREYYLRVGTGAAIQNEQNARTNSELTALGKLKIGSLKEKL